ncbi:polyprenyl synthetase family protein [Streptomyces sp. NPDC026294]|uniref:polyprenyl synthetase family protein n=1 Tax=Streptomyces sp. NPDC026294 TaxID=3155362 RepID=UPI0033FDE00D
MTTPVVLPQPGDLRAVRASTDAVLEQFLDRKARTAAGRHLPTEVTAVLRGFLMAGGKRLRPLLCVTGWHAAGGHGALKPVLQTAASLEMFHAFALIHDDIMDNSDTRRGQPTVHRTLTARHPQTHTLPGQVHTGTGAALLIGDLALSWSDELLHSAGLTTRQLTAVLPLIDTMRTEVMYGQYLDLTATGHPTDDLQRALAIAHYKTAKYTVERPLHIGATLAGASEELLAALSDFALPMGEAFQLRDDLLGVFGTASRTGKPVQDDLRDGKHTALIALALQRATPHQHRTLTDLLGNPALDEKDAQHLRHILIQTRAPQTIEQLIDERTRQAERALAHAALLPEAATTLRELAKAATTRTT